MRLTKTVVISQVDTPNLNGHIYTSEALQKAIDKFNGGAVFGQIDMPKGFDPTLDLSKVSHMITELEIKDGNLIGKMETLDTEQGCMLFSLLSSCELDFRMCGEGTCKSIGEHVEIEDFVLHSINAVSNGA